MTSRGAAGTSPQPSSSAESSVSVDKRAPQLGGIYSRGSEYLAAVVIAAAFIARLIPAQKFFLNPDEALHNLLASQSSLARAYQAGLTNAHPPLLILILYYWRALGQSDLWLRVPSVLAGTACCWLLYEWLKLVVDRSTAFLGLLLISFAPSLIFLSAEIRQYALLLFFMTACLYLSELALLKNSAGLMILFLASLYGALLTHYSSFIFAFAIGVYLLVRLYPYHQKLKLFLLWGAGQVGGVALAVYFLTTHLPRLRKSGMAHEGFDTYLRKSVFHSSDQNAVTFLAAQTLRVFTYLFSHGLVGALTLLMFIVGMVWLLRPKRSRNAQGPSHLELALLLGIPFVANWGAALAGLYPLGATRHSSFLAPLAITGACIGIAACGSARTWLKAVVIVGCLALCNFFPAPPPPIKPQDQSAALMKSAVTFLNASAPPGSVIFADYQSGLLLGRYVCGHGVVQVFPPLKPMAATSCGTYTVIATSDREWKFSAENFPGQLASAAQTFALQPNTEIWLFYAGWINDSAPALSQDLRRLGCPAPNTFGENILICRVTLPEPK